MYPMTFIHHAVVNTMLPSQVDLGGYTADARNAGTCILIVICATIALIAFSVLGHHGRMITALGRWSGHPFYIV